MHYLGGKYRLAPILGSILTKERGPNQVFVDAFAGAFNITSVMTHPRIANDVNPYLTALYEAVRCGWTPPDSVSREEYYRIKNAPEEYPKCLVGFVGFGCSFGGKWFKGYSVDRTGRRDYAKTASRSLIKQRDSLKDVDIRTGSYLDLKIPENSLVYCDPPYKGTTKYNYCKDFDHDRFWVWTRTLANKGHTVFVSEYSAPKWATCIWEREHKTFLSRNKSQYKSTVEKLFRVA